MAVLLRFSAVVLATTVVSGSSAKPTSGVLRVGADPMTRAKAIVAQMTLGEKMGLIQGVPRKQSGNGSYVGACVRGCVRRRGCAPLRATACTRSTSHSLAACVPLRALIYF